MKGLGATTQVFQVYFFASSFHRVLSLRKQLCIDRRVLQQIQQSDLHKPDGLLVLVARFTTIVNQKKGSEGKYTLIVVPFLPYPGRGHASPNGEVKDVFSLLRFR